MTHASFNNNSILGDTFRPMLLICQKEEKKTKRNLIHTVCNPVCTSKWQLHQWNVMERKKKIEFAKWPFSLLIALPWYFSNHQFVKQIPFDLFVYTFYSRREQNKCKYWLAQKRFSVTLGKECFWTGDNVLVAFSLAHFHISIRFEKCRSLKIQTHTHSLEPSFNQKLIGINIFQSQALIM